MSDNTQILAPFLAKIMDGLLTLATQSTDDVLALVLESLRIVMSVSCPLLVFVTLCMYESFDYAASFLSTLKSANQNALLPVRFFV